MSPVDLVILLILLLSLLSGWRRGALAELGSLAVLLLLPWALASFSHSCLEFWNSIIPNLQLAQILALVTPVLLLLWAGKYLGRVLQKLLPRLLLPLNSLAGVALSLAKTLLWLGLVASFLSRLPHFFHSSLWQEALLLEPLALLGDLCFLTIGNLLARPQSKFTNPGELI